MRSSVVGAVLLTGAGGVGVAVDGRDATDYLHIPANSHIGLGPDPAYHDFAFPHAPGRDQVLQTPRRTPVVFQLANSAGSNTAYDALWR